jgi:5S rRNA maturation endonuclease (ribonuclease M5)
MRVDPFTPPPPSARRGAGGSGWIEQVKSSASVRTIAAELGMKPGSLGSFGPCPACGHDRRSKGDRRGAIGASGDGKGWQCHVSGCGVKGDVIELVALRVAGSSGSALTDDGWRQVRAWFAARGLADAGSGPSDPPRFVSGGGGPARRPGGARRVSGVTIDGDTGDPSEEPSGGQRGPALEWSDGLSESCASVLWSEAGEPVLAYLRGRGFNDDTIRFWELGALLVEEGGAVVERWLAIPLADLSGRVVNVRFRSVDGPCLRCSGVGCNRCAEGRVKKSYRVCAKRPLPLFGSKILAADVETPVIVTEGELDAISLWQYGFESSVVSGTGGAGTWKEDWSDALERYRSFLLFYDDDDAGTKGAEAFAEKMGRYRSIRVKLPKNDANDCLRAGIAIEEIERAIELGESMQPVQLRSASGYVEEFLELVRDPGRLRGAPTGSVNLDKAIGGWRSELVTITGATSDGKTTLAHWALYEQAIRGFPVGITSFEQKPLGSIQKLVRLRLGDDFTKFSEPEIRKAFEDLDELPIYVANHIGNIEPAALFDLIRYGIRRYGIRRFLIDHVGYVVDPRIEDERKGLDWLIRALQTLAWTEDVTIFLIVHPDAKPGKEGRRTRLTDAKGSSSIPQDTDTGLVVERMKGTKEKPLPFPMSRIHVDKCRSEFGSAGIAVTLAFDPVSTVYGDSWEATPAARRPS